MKVKSRVVTKLISTILLLSISLAIVLIARNPITGYELSIYRSLFPLTIILLTVPIITGIGLIILGLYRKENYWQLGLLLVMLSNLVLVLLPYIKGYAFSDGGDHLSHLGFAMDILNTGRLSNTDIYPVTHLLVTQLCLVLNIPPEIMINFIGPLFYVFFVLFSYLCAKEILSKPATILATTSSTVLFCFYYYEIFPMGFAFIMFPFIYFLYFKFLKTGSAAVLALLIIMIVVEVFFHPLASFMLAVSFLVMELSNSFLRRFYVVKTYDNSVFSNRTLFFNSNLPMISLFSLVLWIWAHVDVWNGAMISVAGWFYNTGLSPQSMTVAAQESFNKLGWGLLEQLQLFIKIYGHDLIFLVLSIFASIMVIRRVFARKDKFQEVFSYSLFFLPVVTILLIDLVRPLTILTSGRLHSLLIVMFPVLVGVALEKLRNASMKGNIENAAGLSLKKFIKAVTIGLILSACSLIGIFSLYNSPYIYQPFSGISHTTFAGEAWLVQNGNPDINMLSIYAAPPHRIATALWGADGGNYMQTDVKGIDYHFGYDSQQMLGESYTGDRYLFIVSSDKRLYDELWPQVGRLNLDDFAKLEGDISVSHIYSSKEAQNYYIHGLAPMQ
jgi:hypothetical protein